MKKLHTALKNVKGISMPEIMAGITIMTILAGTGVSSAVNQIEQARLTTTMDEMKSIRDALMLYHIDHPGDTISTTTTLITQKYLAEGFTDAPDSDLKTDWKKDAWGKAYKLTSPSIEADGDSLRGSLESGGPDAILDDKPETADYNESKDNIVISLEPMISGD